jgi:DNA-binding CsgD family transcriptional regulator
MVVETKLKDPFSELIISLGEVSFPIKLLEYLAPLAGVNHLSLVHLEEKNNVTYVFSASDDHVEITEDMQQLYLSIYYRLDPNKEFLTHFNSDSDVLIKRLQPQEITDLGYRKLWYQSMGIIDRLSILFSADKGLYCLNLFRTDNSFTNDEIKRLEGLSSVLSALSVKHARLRGVLSNFMTRDTQISTLKIQLSNIDNHLTKRELDVCSRILLGMSSEGISLDLCIKVQSVQTYRKRAYARLNISSQNELFYLCLIKS